MPASPFLNVTYLGFGDLTVYHFKRTNDNRYLNCVEQDGILLSERHENYVMRNHEMRNSENYRHLFGSMKTDTRRIPCWKTKITEVGKSRPPSRELSYF